MIIHHSFLKKYSLMSFNFNEYFGLYLKETNWISDTLKASSLYSIIVDNYRSLRGAPMSVEVLTSGMSFRGREMLVTSDSMDGILEELRKYTVLEELGK